MVRREQYACWQGRGARVITVATLPFHTASHRACARDVYVVGGDIRRVAGILARATSARR